MINFEYYTPTKVVFGKNTEEQTGKLVKAEGCRKVLVHYGGKSAVKSGLLDRICRSLEMEGVEYVTLGGVVPNPRLSMVHEGIALCRKEEVDFILAVGGGSVIDSSKAIGYGAANEGEVWDFYDKSRNPQACLPVGAVLTIAAAGSEMSNSSVITNEDGWLKRGLNNDLCRCRFAVMNPELTYTLPAYQTACGCVDIIMHTMERYFTREKDTMLTDGIGEALMRTVMDNARILMGDPENYNARAQVMWAGSLSHNGLTGCGTEGDWACHQLEHELSAREMPERFAQFAVNVCGVTNRFTDPERTALEGIRRMEEFFREIGMPVSIGDMGIALTEEKIRELAHKCSFFGTRTIGAFKKLDEKDMEEIYRAAR